MLILLGVIYFGYAGLTKQRQGVAAAYGAWLPSGAAQAVELLTDFWSWAGPAQGTGAQATAGDTTLALPENRPRQGDEYYDGYTDYAGNPVPPAIPIQLVAGTGLYNPTGLYNQWLPNDPGDGNDVFEQSRLAVELWNYALGHTVQSFTWTPGQGAVQQMNTNWDDFSRYLNTNFPTGFVTADPLAPQPPAIGMNIQANPQFDNQWIVVALDGPPGGAQWLQRRTVVSQATYNPPFFPQIFSDAGALPNTSFTNYIAGNYPTPAFVPTATQRFDVTGRDSNVFRYAVGEGGQTSSNLIDTQIPRLLGATALPDPDQPMDNQQLGANGNPNGPTMQNAWTPW